MTSRFGLRDWRGQRLRGHWRIAGALPALLCTGLGACSLPGPPPTQYVLGTESAARPIMVSQTQLPVVLVERVRLPEYLDTTDLVARKGVELVASPKGRWGERLSVGFTRSLVDSLSACSSQWMVTSSTTAGRPARRIEVEIADFESTGHGQVILSGRWALLDGSRGERLVAQQIALFEPIDGSGDGAVVNAMSRAVDELAQRIAAAIAASPASHAIPETSDTRSGNN